MYDIVVEHVAMLWLILMFIGVFINGMFVPTCLTELELIGMSLNKSAVLQIMFGNRALHKSVFHI